MCERKREKVKIALKGHTLTHNALRSNISKYTALLKPMGDGGGGGGVVTMTMSREALTLSSSLS